MARTYISDDGFVFRYDAPLSHESMAAMEVWTPEHGWIPVADKETRSHAAWFGRPADAAHVDDDTEAVPEGETDTEAGA